jgi:hypothetical protein
MSIEEKQENVKIATQVVEHLYDTHKGKIWAAGILVTTVLPFMLAALGNVAGWAFTGARYVHEVNIAVQNAPKIAAAVVLQNENQLAAYNAIVNIEYVADTDYSFAPVPAYRPPTLDFIK